ncbi:hypothetical protein HK101_008081 [Irineochytrium annulatum]|nr:hypothetical protein HK101_008081 [Irineochytrium annulatum]
MSSNDSHSETDGHAPAAATHLAPPGSYDPIGSGVVPSADRSRDASLSRTATPRPIPSIVLSTEGHHVGTTPNEPPSPGTARPGHHPQPVVGERENHANDDARSTQGSTAPPAMPQPAVKVLDCGGGASEFHLTAVADGPAEVPAGLGVSKDSVVTLISDEDGTYEDGTGSWATGQTFDGSPRSGVGMDAGPDDDDADDDWDEEWDRGSKAGSSLGRKDSDRHFRDDECASQHQILDDIADGLAGIGLFGSEKQMRKLFKDEMDDDERMCHDFVCAFYPDLIPRQGKLFLTPRHLAFASNITGIKICLEWSDILAIERAKTVLFIPNAIEIKTTEKNYFFASFVNRDLAHHHLEDLLSRSRLRAREHPSPDPSVDFGVSSGTLAPSIASTATTVSTMPQRHPSTRSSPSKPSTFPRSVSERPAAANDIDILAVGEAALRRAEERANRSLDRVGGRGRSETLCNDDACAGPTNARVAKLRRGVAAPAARGRVDDGNPGKVALEVKAKGESGIAISAQRSGGGMDDMGLMVALVMLASVLCCAVAIGSGLVLWRMSSFVGRVEELVQLLV